MMLPLTEIIRSMFASAFPPPHQYLPQAASTHTWASQLDGTFRSVCENEIEYKYDF